MEQNNKLTPAFINEKDVCTDFIYDMFDYFGEIIENRRRNRTHVVGYWNGRLIEVTWHRYDNTIAFAFVDLMENKHTAKDEEKLIEFIKDVDTGNSGLVVKVHKEGDWILSDLYFAE